LSTLTKVLIVLLTLSTIYLCGSVVTYVATAENYKQKVDSLNNDVRSFRAKARGAEDKYQDEKQLKDQLEKELLGEIAALENEKTQLQTNMRELDRQKAELEGKVNSWVEVVKNFSSTTDEQMGFLSNTLDELEKIRADQIAAGNNFLL